MKYAVPLSITLLGLSALLANPSALAETGVSCHYQFSAAPIPSSDGCKPGGGMNTGKYVSEKEPDNPNGWDGPVSVDWGAPGANFKIRWDNNAVAGMKHQEFDYSIVRAPDSQFGREQGYGNTRLSQFEGIVNKATGAQGSVDGRMSFNGGYTGLVPEGRRHTQAILWLNRAQNTRSRYADAAGNTITPTASQKAAADHPAGYWMRGSIDVTVATHYWHDAGANGRVPDLGPKLLESTNETQDRRLLGPMTMPDGSNYKIYRRFPGDVGERASYLLIRDTDAPAGYNEVDSAAVMKRIIAMEAARNDLIGPSGTRIPVVDSTWIMAQMGWEIAGQSGSTGGVAANSKAEFTFGCYSIPVLNGNMTLPGGKVLDAYQPCANLPVVGGTNPNTPPTGPTTGTGTPVLKVSNPGPIVSGTLTNVEQGRTLVLTPRLNSGSVDNVNVIVGAGGAFSADLTGKPKFINGDIVYTYVVNKAGKAGSDQFSFRRSSTATPPSIEVTARGPIVRGTVAGVETGQTLVLGPPNSAGAIDNVNVLIQTGGVWAIDLTSKPRFIDKGTVNMYVENKAHVPASGTFQFVR